MLKFTFCVLLKKEMIVNDIRFRCEPECFIESRADKQWHVNVVLLPQHKNEP